MRCPANARAAVVRVKIVFRMGLALLQDQSDDKTRGAMKALTGATQRQRFQAARAAFAISASRSSRPAVESDTKTAIATWRPSGRVIIPTSFVARVSPCEVLEVPVLCAT